MAQAASLLLITSLATSTLLHPCEEREEKQGSEKGWARSPGPSTPLLMPWLLAPHLDSRAGCEGLFHKGQKMVTDSGL